MIYIKERNEKGLHCRFCNTQFEELFEYQSLYETSPIKGIVCSVCMEHLKSYVKVKKSE